MNEKIHSVAITMAMAAMLALASAAPDAIASRADMQASSFADLTLDQLSNIQVTSVSRRAERLADASASVYVISADDIRRSGVTTLPEALRLAPNLYVARADANRYAVTSRGFASVLANKMLVLVDGRTVYSPLFSGVFWEAQAIMLEDVERIEVISGPGGALWGSNAVNGVINVISRSSKDTHGTLVAAGGGNGAAGGAIRYGLGLAGGGSLRMYARYALESSTSDAQGAAIRDASSVWQGGFRFDSSGARDTLTLQGDAYSNGVDQAPAPALRRINGANVLGRWMHDLGNGGSLKVQAYWDRGERKQPGAINEKLDTFDIEIQHGFKPFADHLVLWGIGYRRHDDRVENVNVAALAFVPAGRRLDLASAFIQDEYTVRPGLNLIAGVKAERNDFTGWETMPNVRIGWKPTDNQLVWGAVSRAVRSPSRIDREFFSPGIAPSFVVAGGANFRSEIATVYELGYRAQPSKALNWALTAYHHDFDRLRSLEPGLAGPVFANRVQGKLNGIEAWGAYRLSDSVRVKAGFVRQKVTLQPESGATALGGTSGLGNDPDFWWTLSSTIDLASNLDLDVSARRAGPLANPAVPAYTAYGARIGWRVRRDLEISVTGNNLVDPRHAEWGAAPGRAEYERSWFLKLLWRM